MRSIPAPAVQVDAPSECVPDLVDDECDGRYWPLIIPELCRVPRLNQATRVGALPIHSFLVER
jgi:hypothetical protein